MTNNIIGHKSARLFFIGPNYKFSQNAVINHVVELQQAQERRTPVYSLICNQPEIFNFVRQS